MSVYFPEQQANTINAAPANKRTELTPGWTGVTFKDGTSVLTLLGKSVTKRNGIIRY